MGNSNSLLAAETYFWNKRDLGTIVQCSLGGLDLVMPVHFGNLVLGGTFGCMIVASGG